MNDCISLTNKNAKRNDSPFLDVDTREQVPCVNKKS